MSLDLDTFLRLLSISGYSLFSLIDDILARGEWEDQTIKLLQEGIERDAVDICARLLNHRHTSSSISEWALSVAQSTLPSDGKDIHHDSATYHPLSDPFVRRNNVLSPGFSFGTTWASTDDSEMVSQFKNDRHSATVDILLDDVLLDIFDFCLRDSDVTTGHSIERTKKWQTLAHVCQRWRRIIYASPRRLNLHLTCSFGTHVRTNLVFWPVILPLTVNYSRRLDPLSDFGLDPDDEDGVVFALEHARRVHRIEILAIGPILGKVSTVMQKSFPALTHLDLELAHDLSPFPVIPTRFLGGSAPRLQHLRLCGISFPQLPTVLLSARNLVTLKLEVIPDDDYISPEVMVRSLAVMTRLTTLSIAFDDETRTSPSDQWRSRHPDSPTRTILPALTRFLYGGRSEYLEDFFAQINMPRLDHLIIDYYFTRQIQLQLPQLSWFLARTENLILDQLKRAHVNFYYDDFDFRLECPQRKRQVQINLSLVDDEWLDIQVLGLAHVLSYLFAIFPKVAHFSAHGGHVQGREMDSTEWLPLFQLFPAVQALHLSGKVGAYIADALGQADEEMVAEVFPALYLIWLDKSNNKHDEDEDQYEPVGSIEQFLSLRQLSGRPVTVVDTRDEFFEACQEPSVI